MPTTASRVTTLLPYKAELKRKLVEATKYMRMKLTKLKANKATQRRALDNKFKQHVEPLKQGEYIKCKNKYDDDDVFESVDVLNVGIRTREAFDDDDREVIENVEETISH